MNLSQHFVRRAVLAFALFAGCFLTPAGHAQPAAQGSSRYLFIFNTSTDMKKRLPAVQAEVNQLLATSLGGRLQPGDGVGVWTFDQDLHAGQFPPQTWRPEDAVGIAAEINKFVGKQRYANRTRFDALQPQLNQVIQNSQRLTVLIFCDGEDDIKGTPYDASINQVFQQRQAAQKKAAQPFVLVLRTQLGQYAGCTLNFPPGMVNVPEFPPLPAPPAPATNPPPPPPQISTPVAPAPTGPPLMIIGKTVVTNWPPAPAALPATNPVSPPANVVPAAVTNPIVPPVPANPTPVVQPNAASAPPAAAPTPTNRIVPENTSASQKASSLPPVMPTNPAAPPTPPVTTAASPTPAPAPSSSPAALTNAAAPTPADATPGGRRMLIIGGALLFAAGALATFAVLRHRRHDRDSLITRSMRKD